jgi:hypothetical protein
MTATAISRRTQRFGALGAVVVAVAAGLAGWQFWPQSGSAESRPPSAPAATVPSWFRPIAHYYRNNPRITPQFDFASLYSGRQPNSHR